MCDSELIQLALSARDKAYAPYSGFCVGAAILASSGEVYTGCNVESAAFGAGICAEQCAVGNAVSRGETSFSIIAVASGAENLCMPCGICRQLLYEFSPDLIVLCADRNGRYEKYSLRDLLPHAFGSF